MPRIELEYADGFYVSQSPGLIEKRVVNVYPVIPQAEAVSKRALLRTPGTKELADFGDLSSRGVLVFTNGTPYRVIGNELVSVSALGVKTIHGKINGTSDVSMASNGINVAIQDPFGGSYFFTPSTNILEVNDDSAFLNQGQAKTVTYKDGFYIYTTESIFFSGSAKTTNDGKDFNALDFADAETSPDKTVKGHNNHNQLYIFGETAAEVYQTVATSGFPFKKIPGAIIQKGCAAANSVIDFDNTMLFLGGGKGELPAIWRVTGSSAQKVSTSSVDYLIQGSTPKEISETRAFSYAQNGDYFAVFSVGSHTFVYDATTSALSGKHEWHERQTGVTDGNNYLPWRSIHGVKAYGKIQVGDDRSGVVGELDFDLKKEYGERVERLFTTKPFEANGDSIFSHEVELIMRTGVGDDLTPNPKIRMDYSDDGGKTFSGEISRPMGRVGEYSNRVRWSRLGRIPNSRVLRFKMSDPVEFNVYSLFANAESVNSG